MSNVKRRFAIFKFFCFSLVFSFRHIVTILNRNLCKMRLVVALWKKLEDCGAVNLDQRVVVIN